MTGHLGVIGYGLDMTGISIPLFATGNKKPRRCIRHKTDAFVLLITRLDSKLPSEPIDSGLRQDRLQMVCTGVDPNLRLGRG